jgi:hypothetical protein
MTTSWWDLNLLSHVAGLLHLPLATRLVTVAATWAGD